MADTVVSVASQRYGNLEYIVVDGGSTDGTLEVLTDHAAYIDLVINGPDGGIADAMNRALRVVSGDLVLFLHADDRFVSPDALGSALAHISDLDHVWAFDVLFGSGVEARRISPRPFNPWVWLKNPLPHQGVLCPTTVFERLGLFDASLKVDMDYEFWLRAYRAGFGVRRVPEVLTVMGDQGVSSRSDWRGLSARFAEERHVQAIHAQEKPWRWLYQVYWPCYLLYRRLRCEIRGLA